MPPRVSVVAETTGVVVAATIGAEADAMTAEIAIAATTETGAQVAMSGPKGVSIPSTMTIPKPKPR
jgi:hypothetical protein